MDAHAGPVVELQAEARSQLPNDEMVVELALERTGDKAEALNDEVLKQLESALATARGVAGVKSRLGSVTTQPEWGPKGGRTGWRVRGSLVLEGQNLKATGALAGRLAETLQIASVQFRLTPAARAREESRLLKEAAAAFSTRAQETAQAFGFSQFRIRTLNINHAPEAPVRPVVMARMRGAADAMAAPASVPTDGGEADVVLTIAGSVELDR